VRSVGSAAQLGNDQSFLDEAVGNQADYQRKSKFQADLSDVLIVSVVLAEVLKNTVIRTVAMDGINAFQSVGLNAQDCAEILTHADYQLGVLHDALGV